MKRKLRTKKNMNWIEYEEEEEEEQKKVVGTLNFENDTFI